MLAKTVAAAKLASRPETTNIQHLTSNIGFKTSDIRW
jgi:hypothetical protein